MLDEIMGEISDFGQTKNDILDDMYACGDDLTPHLAKSIKCQKANCEESNSGSETHAMVMQASRTTCDRRSCTDMRRHGSRVRSIC